MLAHCAEGTGMTNETISTAAPSAPDDAAAPEQKPWWKRVRPFWKLRGVIAAFGFVGVLDHLEIVRSDVLGILHAVGARWNEWMGWLTNWISLQVPIYLTSLEGTALSVYLLLVAPSVVLATVNAARGDRVQWVGALASCLAMLGSLVLLAFPRDTFAIPFVAVYWVLIATMATLNSMVTMHRAFHNWPALSAFRWIMTIATLIFLPLVWYATTAPEFDELASIAAESNSWDLESGASPAFALLMASSVIGVTITALWVFARDYLIWMVVTLTFLLTLEVIYLAPIVQKWMKPAVDFINPEPLHEQPSPFAPPT